MILIYMSAQNSEKKEKAIKFDPENLKFVPIELVHPNSWNPKDKNTPEFEKVKRSLAFKGLRLPIVVRNSEKKGHFEIIDGEQRHRAALELGYRQIIIYNEGDLSDKEARELTIWYEQTVPFNQVDLSYLVVDMMDTWEDVELPFSEDELEEMIKVTNLDMDDFEKNQNEDDEKTKGVLSSAYTVTLSQKRIIDQAIHKVKSEQNGPEMSDGRALELIAGDFLAGA